MKEKIITFETAKLAKDKGFEVEVTSYYKEAFPENLMIHGIKCNFNKYVELCCSAPTQSLLQKWLREKHNLDILITKPENSYWDVYIWGETRELFFPNECAKSYEEALEKGLKNALNLIK